ncbi:MAG TPA: hypothetical protein VFQ35_09000, partial [Polyangiaceae bacterium]|nr:hypothetical protein [Polyangiaceae bacterium]
AALDADLEFLKEDRCRVDGAALAAELFAQRLRGFARDSPGTLGGVFYVLEGSALGAKQQLGALRVRPELAAGGLEYLTRSAGAAPRFAEFLRRLEAELVDRDAVEAAVTGASATFEAFDSVLTNLLAAPGRIDATLLNGDAGQHAIADDLREIAAALRAGEATYEKYGYYRARYGERGMRFTRSDSAWIASLAARESSVVVRELRWLAGVLAHRGMPRYLLEDHLSVLADELERAVPERAGAYAKLLAARDHLRSERHGLLGEERFRELASGFDRALPAELDEPLRRSGFVVVAAVLDEASGIAKAVSSVETWFTQQNFPGSLSDAVRETLRATRRAISSAQPLAEGL